MATLATIEAHLDLELGNRRLRDGKKKPNKNRYYYYENLYYIVELSKGMWMIVEDCRKSRELLRNHCWCYNSTGYAIASSDGEIKKWHQRSLNYEDGLVCDHINGMKFDNLLNNLRVVTQRENMRNKRTPKNNVTGKQGVSLLTEKKSGRRYWSVRISDNDGKIVQKYFSIDRHGDMAKVMAIAERKRLELLYGYIGE